MDYNLKQQSNISKFYAWIWNTDVTKNKTMCAYFWKYILTITFLPLIIFIKVIYFLLPNKKEFNKKIEVIGDTIIEFKPVKVIVNWIKWDLIKNILLGLYIIIIFLTLLSILIIAIIEFYKNPMFILAIFGVISLVIIIVVLLYVIFTKENVKKK